MQYLKDKMTSLINLSASSITAPAPPSFLKTSTNEDAPQTMYAPGMGRVGEANENASQPMNARMGSVGGAKDADESNQSRMRSADSVVEKRKAETISERTDELKRIKVSVICGTKTVDKVRSPEERDNIQVHFVSNADTRRGGPGLENIQVRVIPGQENKVVSMPSKTDSPSTKFNILQHVMSDVKADKSVKQSVITKGIKKNVDIGAGGVKKRGTSPLFWDESDKSREVKVIPVDVKPPPPSKWDKSPGHPRTSRWDDLSEPISPPDNEVKPPTVNMSPVKKVIAEQSKGIMSSFLVLFFL